MEALAACRLAATLLASMLAAPALAQSTWFVDCSWPGPGSGTPSDPYHSIQYALHQPSTLAGDLLLVAPGTYHENISIDRGGVTLRSMGGAEATVLQARAPGSAVVVRHDDRDHPTRIEGFTIAGGSGTAWSVGTIGGGVFLDGAPTTLLDCLVQGNHALRGGGVAAVRAELTLEGVVIDGNVAELAPRTKDGHGGGLYLEESPQATLRGGRVSSNLAGRGGGIYSFASRLDMDGVLIEGNHTSPGDFLDDVGEGGGLYAFAGRARLHEVVFSENLARGWGTQGGGARLVKTGTRILGGAFRGNAVGAFWPDTPTGHGRGGAISSDAELEVVGTELVANVAPLQGGAICGRGRFESCSLRENRARFGGAAWTPLEAMAKGCYAGWLRFERCELVGNVAENSPWGASGGAVCGPAYLERCRLAQNGVRGDGGAASHATLIDCVLEDNVAGSALLAPTSRGGAAFESHLDGCVVKDNRSIGVDRGCGFGGGVWGGTVRRTVLSGNEADFGGAIAMPDAALMDHLTIWGNRAAQSGGGIYLLAPGRLRNSIVYRNGPECIAGAVDRAVVTWSDVQGGCPGLGNDDILPCFWAPEADDYHLVAGSPCIDSGDPLSPPDPDGSRADRGAVPFAADWCGPPVNVCQPKTSSAGCLPSLVWRGSPTVGGADDFVVGAVAVHGQQPGVLLLSTYREDTPLAGGGVLCLGQPLMRVATQISSGNAAGVDCSGAFQFPLSQAFFAGHGLGAGQTLFAQALYRDTGWPPPLDLGLTDALRFTLCP